LKIIQDCWYNRLATTDSSWKLWS